MSSNCCTFEALLSNSLALDSLIAIWDQTLAGSFGYDHLSDSERETVTNKINAFYFGRETTPTNQLDRNHLVDVRTNSRFISLSYWTYWNGF